MTRAIGIMAAARTLPRLVRVSRILSQHLRRVLRRVGDGDLGRVCALGVERMAERLSRGIERLASAVASAAVLVAGSLVVGMDGWRRVLGLVLLIVGKSGSPGVAPGAWFTSRRQ